MLPVLGLTWAVASLMLGTSPVEALQVVADLAAAPSPSEAAPALLSMLHAAKEGAGVEQVLKSPSWVALLVPAGVGLGVLLAWRLFRYGRALHALRERVVRLWPGLTVRRKPTLPDASEASSGANASTGPHPLRSVPILNASPKEAARIRKALAVEALKIPALHTQQVQCVRVLDKMWNEWGRPIDGRMEPMINGGTLLMLLIRREIVFQPDHLRVVLVHEIGHAAHRVVEIRNLWRWAEWPMALLYVLILIAVSVATASLGMITTEFLGHVGLNWMAWASVMSVVGLIAAFAFGPFRWTLQAAHVSNYAMTNVREDFAETYEAFVHRPATLSQRAQTSLWLGVKYRAMLRVFNVVERLRLRRVPLGRSIGRWPWVAYARLPQRWALQRLAPALIESGLLVGLGTLLLGSHLPKALQMLVFTGLLGLRHLLLAPDAFRLLAQGRVRAAWSALKTRGVLSSGNLAISELSLIAFVLLRALSPTVGWFAALLVPGLVLTHALAPSMTVVQVARPHQPSPMLGTVARGLLFALGLMLLSVASEMFGSMVAAPASQLPPTGFVLPQTVSRLMRLSFDIGVVTLTEELIFKRWLFGHLLTRLPPRFANIVQAGMFTGVHYLRLAIPFASLIPYPALEAPRIFAHGLVLGLAYRRLGLAGSVIAHLVQNALVTLIVLFRWTTPSLPLSESLPSSALLAGLTVATSAALLWSVWRWKLHALSTRPPAVKHPWWLVVESWLWSELPEKMRAFAAEARGIGESLLAAAWRHRWAVALGSVALVLGWTSSAAGQLPAAAPGTGPGWGLVALIGGVAATGVVGGRRWAAPRQRLPFRGWPGDWFKRHLASVRKEWDEWQQRRQPSEPGPTSSEEVRRREVSSFQAVGGGA